MSEREHRFSRHMSDTEALMWAAEKDPWLSSAIGSVSSFGSPIDVEWFRRKIAKAVSVIPRMRERVVPGIHGLAPPRWATDPEFDLDDHIKVVQLAEPGSVEQRNEVIADLFMTPFDRAKPVWSFTIINGLADGGSTLVMKLHHSIADGVGTLRLSEEYIDFDAKARPPDEIDLREVIAAAVRDNPPPDDFRSVVTDSLTHFTRRQAGIARRAAGEVALWGADPGRVANTAAEAADVTRLLANQAGLGGGGSSTSGGSPLWANRSRHRHFETVDLDLQAGKQLAKSLGGSLNDWFVAGVHLGVRRYHEARECAVDHFNGSFVVSTRDDAASGGNSFAPVTLRLSGAPADAATTFAADRALMEAIKHSARRGGASTEVLAGLAALLPTSMITRAGRARAARQDFATSNLRGSPIPLFIGGVEMTGLHPIGPVAGTAFNVTALSYRDNFGIGMMIDPVAVDEPAALRSCIEAAFADLADAS